MLDKDSQGGSGSEAEAMLALLLTGPVLLLLNPLPESLSSGVLPKAVLRQRGLPVRGLSSCRFVRRDLGPPVRKFV